MIWTDVKFTQPKDFSLSIHFYEKFDPSGVSTLPLEIINEQTLKNVHYLGILLAKLQLYLERDF